MAASMGEQTEEGMSRVPVAGVAQPKPSYAWVTASPAGWMEEHTPEASMADVAMGQASASMSPAPSTTGGSALEELLSQEGSVPLGISVEPSHSLV